MTRDFSKQRRDDPRPSSRHSPSGRYGEERSPRPARPHLNRASVDRAWENGAPQNHPDYRGGRNNNRNGQPPRNNRRDSQFDHPSAQYSRNRPNSPGNYASHNNRPYGNRQDNQQYNENAPYGNRNPQDRSTDFSVRDSGTPRFNDRRGQGTIHHTPGDRSDSYRGNRDNAGYRDSGDQYHDRNANQRNRYQGRDFDRDNRYSRDVDHDNRSSRNFDRDSRAPRNFNRDTRSPRNFDRNNRPYPSRGRQGPDTQNPRWQSRPAMQRGNAYSRPAQDFPRQRPQEEHFEGDYERFDERKPSQRPSESGRFKDNPSDRHDEVANEPPELPVTRLPDGRVLKGPRPVQRKNAQFWNEIGDETEALLDPVHTPPSEQPTDLPDSAPAKPAKPKAQPRQAAPSTPRKRAASAVSRERKPGTRKTGAKKEKAAKARSTGPKPSKRGFKWPSP